LTDAGQSLTSAADLRLPLQMTPPATEQPAFFSPQVSAARRFYLDLSPPPGRRLNAQRLGDFPLRKLAIRRDPRHILPVRNALGRSEKIDLHAMLQGGKCGPVAIGGRREQGGQVQAELRLQNGMAAITRTAGIDFEFGDELVHHASEFRGIMRKLMDDFRRPLFHCVKRRQHQFFSMVSRQIVEFVAECGLLAG
jgi:hypothetical protein